MERQADVGVRDTELPPRGGVDTGEDARRRSTTIWGSRQFSNASIRRRVPVSGGCGTLSSGARRGQQQLAVAVADRLRGLEDPALQVDRLEQRGMTEEHFRAPEDQVSARVDAKNRTRT